MPIFLEPRDTTTDLKGFDSVLIVACPVCPAMSLAMQKDAPFIDLFRHGLKTPAFEEYIASVREPLEERGVRTDVCTMHAPSPFMCLWTKGQRDRLKKRADDYEAVLVLGCDSAIATATDVLKDTNCQIRRAMRMKGTANATTKFRFPATVEFDRHSPQKKESTKPREDAADARQQGE